MIDVGTYKAKQTEAEFQRAVLKAAELHGWLCVHFPAMLANPAGWPDLLCFRDGQTLIGAREAGDGRGE